MSVFLKNKFNPKKAAQSSPYTENRVDTPLLIKKIRIDLQDIFNKSSRYPLKKIKEKIFKITPDNQLSTQQLERAYLFVSRYFKAKDMLYHIIQADKGKNFELAADFKTTLAFPVLNTAKSIPVPIIGNVLAAGGKKVFKSRSDKKRINRANQKLACMLISDELVDLMMTLFVKIHIENIKKNKINQPYRFLKKELEIFFAIAKKEIEQDSEPQNLEDFWANIFSTYLQHRINPRPKYQSLKYKFWATQSSNNRPLFDVPSLTRFLNEDLDILLDEKRFGPASLVHRSQSIQTTAVADPQPSPPDPQPGPEITFTLNPTLSPQGLTLTNPPPKALAMNLIIPENPGGHPITIRVPSVNQPLLINLLADTSSTVYATQASQTHPVVLSNPSPPTTTPPCNPWPTHLTPTGCTEVKPLPVQPRVTSGETVTAMRQELTPMTKSLSNTPPSPLITTSPAHATTATLNKMNKTETPQCLSRDTHSPAVTLSQLQACVKLTACVAALALTQHALDLPIKSGATTGLSQTVQSTFKPSGPAFFSYGTATQQINNRPSCAHLSSAAA